jgi:hypothetical protein
MTVIWSSPPMTAEKVRAFFADVLNMRSADAGGGWLIFALPPAELAVHPAEGDSHHELYLMCDDIHPPAPWLEALFCRSQLVHLDGVSARS